MKPKVTRDERGRFAKPDPTVYKVNVWDYEGNIVKYLPEATEDELDEIEEIYGDDPHYMIQVEQP